jgi:hypothetical protein
MPTIEVQPRQTPGESARSPVAIEVDDDISVNATVIEDWTAARSNWEFTLHQGHDFGRQNNVEGRILLVAGEQTTTLTFRLDQLDVAEDTGEELILRFEDILTFT